MGSHTSAVCAGMLIFSLAFAPQGCSALSPNDKNMIVLTATGSRWGGTEDAFALHEFSLRSSRGNAIWSDRDPDHICLLNPENKTFLVRTLADYAGDIGRFRRGSSATTITSKPTKLTDGTPAAEIIVSQSNVGESHPIQRTVSVSSVVLPEKMCQAWCTIMSSPLSPEKSGFIVSLYRTHHGHRQNANEPPTWRNLVEYKSLKVVPIQTDRFAVPKSYKRAQDETAFYFSTAGGVLKKGDLDDLFLSPVK